MHTEKNIIWLLFAAFLVATACSKHDALLVNATDASGLPTIMSIPKSVIKDSGITTDSAFSDGFKRVFTCQGYAVYGNEYAMSITTPAEGIIRKIFIHKGERIHSGSLIALIENTEFIQLQQEFLEAKNQLEFFKEEYTRQGDLTVENATSIKKMQIAKRDFQSAELRFHSLALRLNLLGISSDSVSIHNMKPAIPVYASKEGIISSLPVREGTYISTGKPIAHFSAGDETFIRLSVPEEAYLLIQNGNTISCVSGMDESWKFEAIVKNISGTINPETGKFAALATVKKSDRAIIPGMSVTATFILNGEPVFMVYPQSVFNSDTTKYIFAKHNNQYHRIKVNTGILTEGRIPVSGLTSAMADSVVISGTQKLASIFRL